MNYWRHNRSADNDYDEEEGLTLLHFVEPRFENNNNNTASFAEMQYLAKLRGKQSSVSKINLGDSGVSKSVAPTIDPSLDTIPRFSPKYDLDNHLKPDLFVFIVAGLILGFILTSFIVAFLVFGTPWMGAYSIIPLIPGGSLLWFFFMRNKLFLNSIQFARICKFFSLGMICLIPIFTFESCISLVINLIESKARPNITQLADEAIFSALLPAIFVSALVEEGFKLFLATQIWVKPQRDHVVSIMIYTVAFSIGLITMESSVYLQLSAISSGNAVKTFCLALVRFLMTLPLVTATGTLIGGDVSCNKFRASKHQKPFWRIFLLPFGLRALFEFFMLFTACLYLQYEKPTVFLLGLAALAVEGIAVWLALRKRSLLLRLEEDFSFFYSQDKNSCELVVT